MEDEYEYDSWEGVVHLDVEFAVRAWSGRPKHTDPEGYGAWMAEILQSRIRELLPTDGETGDFGNIVATGHTDRLWKGWDTPTPPPESLNN